MQSCQTSSQENPNTCEKQIMLTCNNGEPAQDSHVSRYLLILPPCPFMLLSAQQGQKMILRVWVRTD